MKIRSQLLLVTLIFFFSGPKMAWSQSQSYNEEIMALIDQELDPLKKSVLYLKLASVYVYSGDSLEVENCSRTILEILDGFDSEYGKIFQAYIDGKKYMRSGNYLSAYEEFSQAQLSLESLNLSEKEWIIQLESRLNEASGTSLYRIGQYQDSFVHYQKVIEASEKLHDEELRLIMFHTISLIYNKIGDIESAIEISGKGIRLSEEKGFELPAVPYLNLASYFFEVQKMDSCKYYLGKAEKSLADFEDSFTDWRYQRLTIKCLLRMGKIHEAERMFSGIQEGSSLGISQHEMNYEIHELDGDLKSVQGNSQAAIKSYRESVESMNEELDSKNRVRILRKIAALEFELEDFRTSSAIYMEIENLEERITHSSISSLVDFNDYSQLKMAIEEKSRVASLLQRVELKSRNRLVIGILSSFGLLLSVISVFVVSKKNRKIREQLSFLVQKNEEVILKRAIKSNQNLNGDSQKNNSKKLTAVDKRVGEQIKKALETDKLFLDPDISLTKLSSILEINRTYLSSAVNETYKKNFNSVINEFRIQEVLVMLKNKEHLNYTLESMSARVGFNSKSVFNKAFKSYTGLTPSEYINVLSQTP